MSLKKQRQIKRKRKVKMDASKISFTEQTKQQLHNPLLSQRRKTELRKELVFEHIRSKPAGSKIKTSALVTAAGFKLGVSSGYAFLQRMVESGELVRESIPNTKKNYWTIPGDAKTSPSYDGAHYNHCYQGENPDNCKYGDANCPAKKMKPKTNIIPKNIQDMVDVSVIEQKAVAFAWETGSFDVREFIKWLK